MFSVFRLWLLILSASERESMEDIDRKEEQLRARVRFITSDFCLGCLLNLKSEIEFKREWPSAEEAEVSEEEVCELREWYRRIIFDEIDRKIRSGEYSPRHSEAEA